MKDGRNVDYQPNCNSSGLFSPMRLGSLVHTGRLSLLSAKTESVNIHNNCYYHYLAKHYTTDQDANEPLMATHRTQAQHLMHLEPGRGHSIGFLAADHPPSAGLEV